MQGKILSILAYASCGFAVLLLNYLLYKFWKSRNQKPIMGKVSQSTIKGFPKNKLQNEKHQQGIIKDVRKIPKRTQEILQQQQDTIPKIDVESNSIEKPNKKCSENPNYHHLQILTNHLRKNNDGILQQQPQPISKIDVESNIEKSNKKCSENLNYYHLVFDSDEPISEKSIPKQNLNIETSIGPSL